MSLEHHFKRYPDWYNTDERKVIWALKHVALNLGNEWKRQVRDMPSEQITFSRYGRYVTNICQAISLLLLVGQITIQFGEKISQLSKFKLCYAVYPTIFACAGFLISQIRTIRAYGWVANLAVWMNLFVIFMPIAVMAKSPPNYEISVLGSAGSTVNEETIRPDSKGNYPPIVHYEGVTTHFVYKMSCRGEQGPDA